MKSLARNLSALTVLFTTGHGAADVIYSGYQNITIPTTYAGTYIDVQGMTSSTSPITTPGWDLNPFMGGVYLSNSAAFQPARSGTGGMDTVLKFATGDTISATGLNFATGSGGSMTHLGSQFTAGQEGYLGFKLDTPTNYGWMRVVFTNNDSGAVVKDWAYDNTTNEAITTGNIVQSAPSEGAQTVTLTSGTGQSFTLGTQITNSLGNGGGVTNSVVKEGAGTAILTGTNSYSGTTTINAGTLIINGSTSSTSLVTVASGATLGGSGTVGGATTISGTHNPGNSPGIQTFSNNLTYSGNLPSPVVNWELTGNTVTNAANPNAIFDQIIVGGDLDFADLTTLNLSFIAAGSTVLWSDTFWSASQSWTLYDVTGTTTNFADLSLSNINWLDSGSFAFNTVRPGSSFSLSQSGQDVLINYNFVPVPEPRAALLGGLGLLMLLRRSRRQ